MKTHNFSFSISVVIPVFNDEEVLPQLHKRLTNVLPEICPQFEIIYIDDGSADKSLEVLRGFLFEDGNVKIIQLSRNFGQPNAIAAGLDAATGEVVVIMDSDLQDKPEDIPLLLSAMIEGDVCMAVARWKTRKDCLFKVTASRIFNRIANDLTNIHYPARTRVFRAIKREVIDRLQQIPEKTATPLSLIYWMGCDYVTVDLDRDPRYAGKSGYTLNKMLKLSLDRIFSYSLFPIRLASILGIILGCCSILLASYFILQKLVLMGVLPGWTSIVTIVLFLLGLNFIFIGIIGEYLGRIYLESKKRPRYIIEKTLSEPDQRK